MARRRTSETSKKKSNSVSVNFKGVTSRQLLPEDDYRSKLVAAEQGESSNGNDQITFTFAVNNGSKFDGQKLWFHCPLLENSLWKLHGLLTAFGMEVPDDELDIDLDDLVEQEYEIMAVVQQEIYDGDKKSKMVDFYAVEEGSSSGKKDESEEGEGDEKSKDKKQSKKKELDKLSEDKVEDMDRDELEAVIKNYKLDVDADDFKKLPKLQAAVVEALKEEGHLEEAEEDQLTAEAVQEMSEEDLEETIKKFKLDVDLDDYKTLRKKASAVIDALETEGKLKEE